MSEHGLAEHLSATVQRRLRQLSDRRDFANAADPVEALHDLRVASRRLRAFIDVFEPVLGAPAQRRAGKPLRRITRAVRALRDWDVQIGLVGARLDLATTDAERAALEHLLERAAEKRAVEAERTARAYEKVDFGAVRDSIKGALEDVLAHAAKPETEPSRLAWDLLLPFVVEIERDHPGKGAAEHVERLHQLRLDVKKLRYALELFEPVVGPPYAPLYARARDLQDLLGTHHDLSVLEALIDAVHGELESRARTTLVRGLAAAKDRLSAERRHCFAKFREGRHTAEEWRVALRQALFGT